MEAPPHNKQAKPLGRNIVYLNDSLEFDGSSQVGFPYLICSSFCTQFGFASFPSRIARPAFRCALCA